MRKSRIAILASSAVLVAALGLVGCSSQTPAEDTAAPAPEAAAPAEQADTTSSSTSEAPAPTESAPAADQSETAAPAQDSYVGEDAAKQAALADAGLAEADVTELNAELDADDATPHYDVDFKSGGMEYDYDIDAATGAVISGTSEADD